MRHPANASLLRRAVEQSHERASIVRRRLFLLPTPITTRQRLLRLLWTIVWALLYRTSPTPLHGWRRMLLRAFGASIEAGAHPYPRARIWAPWNLRMGVNSCIADDVDCYCVALVSLGRHATVSQYSYLCSASHDYTQVSMPTVCAPISIEEDAWVAADVFIGPGVTVGCGAVVGARSTVNSDVAAWHVVAGSPPRQLRLRPEFHRSGTRPEYSS
jgi:putative colanic acid biosynthesis acetyltransferase WcaF